MYKHPTKRGEMTRKNHRRRSRSVQLAVASMVRRGSCPVVVRRGQASSRRGGVNSTVGPSPVVGSQGGATVDFRAWALGLGSVVIDVPGLNYARARRQHQQEVCAASWRARPGCFYTG